VQGREIAKEFDFKKFAATVLCLSVLPTGVTMSPPSSGANSLSDALDVLKDYLASGNQRLLDSIGTIYRETECCICMDPAPNVVS
jgi:hypothetical protein